MLTLKEYQQKALNAFETYLRLVTQYRKPGVAFYEATELTYGTGIPYRGLEEMRDMPYICLRLPTGGGKTLLACHIIPLAQRTYLHSDHPLVLWLVPSNTIREQTLAALRDRQHPYRQALDGVLGRVNVLDVAEALHVQRPMLDGGTTIIVSTLQAFRVEDTEGRKVYENNGALMPHFDGYSQVALDGLEKWDNGSPIYSLANVLRLRRPLVIVDEAHNARTELSFATLTRFQPSAIVELTATPDTQQNPSNVLYSVSASELQAEDMIKMPIRLETQPQWRELLSSAIAQLDHLEQEARIEEVATGEYLRPIMLLQAQPRYQERESLTVEVLEKTLIEDFKIPAEQIARATGTDRGLEGVDVLAENCPIRYVITVQALREGWDCPFAYVLCSVAELSSSTAVEQMLGRIMRLPRARRKRCDDLNMAYAYAASTSFATTANALVDGLVQNGFTRIEARDLIRGEESANQGDFGPLFAAGEPPPQEISIGVQETIDLAQLPEQLAAKIRVVTDGSIVFRGRMSAEERDALKQSVSSDKSRKAIDSAYLEAQRDDQRMPPSEQGIRFSLPRLAYRQGELLEELSLTHYMEHSWNLLTHEAALTQEEYTGTMQTGQQAEITVDDEGQLVTRFIDNLHHQMTYLATDRGWSMAELVRWIDRAFPHPDIAAAESGAFITRLIQRLMRDRGMSLDQLVHDKYRLAKAIAQKIDDYRQAAYGEALQGFLLPDSPVEVTPELCFTFDPVRYPYNRPYQGRYIFQKHYYPVVGDLRAEGEEFECARYIDTMDEVEFWVRNPERSRKGFSLQTSTDRFYPDFVCKLRDGRFLVIEYKGLVYASNDDSVEKNTIGELWEKRSGGMGLFVMVTDRRYEMIRAKVEGR
jgi:type III restriction enzyme